MEFNLIMSDLKKKIYNPVYFLMGDEPYFIDMVSDYIENKVLDESEKEFNQTVLYGGDITADDVFGAARRFPMMSEYQVIIVKEAQSIKNIAGKEKEKEKKDEDKAKLPLELYLENPLKSTILVICYKYKSVDKRTSLYKSLDKKAVLLESKKIYDNQVAGWIDNYLKGKSFSIGPKASSILAECLGTSLSKITNELDKLMINIPPKSEITMDMIQANIGISKDYNIFELQNAIGKKEVLKANRIVNYFGSNEKDHPLVMTVSILYGYFCKLLLYHHLPDKSQKAVMSSLGIPFNFVDDYKLAGKNYDLNKLKRIFSYLRDYDLKSKGLDRGSASEGILLKEMVFKILH